MKHSMIQHGLTNEWLLIPLLSLDSDYCLLPMLTMRLVLGGLLSHPTAFASCHTSGLPIVGSYLAWPYLTR